jgi:hypothetical protein
MFEELSKVMNGTFKYERKNSNFLLDQYEIEAGILSYYDAIWPRKLAWKSNTKLF